MIKRSLLKKIMGSTLGLMLIATGQARQGKTKMFSGKVITGLYFHNPSHKQFEKCIRWLRKKNCVFLSGEDVLAILTKQKEMPRGGVWISVDDGWKGNMKGILPTMVHYAIPITFFIATGPVENEGFFWFSLARQFNYSLPPPYRHNVRQLWTIPEKTRKKVMENVYTDTKFRVLKENSEREAMTIEELQELATHPWVSFGSHTVNHVIIPHCTEEELREEVALSKRKLEEWTGKKISFFSYPNGDCNGEEKKILMEAGFALAVTSQKRFINQHDDLYLVPRFCVNDDTFFPEALCQMVGTWGSLMERVKDWKKMILPKKEKSCG